MQAVIVENAGVLLKLEPQERPFVLTIQTLFLASSALLGRSSSRVLGDFSFLK
jgi:hypothetical protein